MRNILSLFFFLTIPINCFSQNIFSILSIPENLKENSNAVVRLSQKDIVISSKQSMNVFSKDVVTVLNAKGLSNLNLSEYFDKTTKVKSIEAIIYNALGQEIKKIKRKDFSENSVSEGSIISDARVIYLNYTPVSYPFTIVFSSEVESSNTSFIPSWYPIPNTFVSVEKSEIKITYPESLGFKYKELNFENSGIEKNEMGNSLSYTAQNLQSIKSEEFSPAFRNFVPHVMFGLSNFNYEGVDGVASDWKNFGSWMYDSLLKGTDEVPAQTQAKILELVGTEKDPIKIAKIVYNYVQSKTRYISIQLGIGGWKPMLAKDVDRLGYGDCKALTNYTRALLKVAGVPSYYTIIYSDDDRRDLQHDFVSMQGNHAILAVPVEGKIYWLECTSQTTPFGFQGTSTDNRWALVVKPEGGEITRTSENIGKSNSQISKGSYFINDQGAITASVSIKSKGTQYENKYGYQGKSPTILDEHYKSYFGNINNLKMKKISHLNNADDIEFAENIDFEAVQYGSLSGTKIMFPLNLFNQAADVPKRYRTRNNPFEIQRGFSDYDEITIDLPKGYKIEAKPDDFELKDVFGYYKTEYVILNDYQILYKRIFETNPGVFNKTEYEKFRKFKEQIVKNDNAKIVIVKN